MAALIVTSGPNEGGYYPLGKRTTVIGRQETCPVQVVDPRISRKHMQIRFDAGTNQFLIVDLKSDNGTFVNGQQLQSETPLLDFDQVRIGDTNLCFISTDFPDQKSALDHYKTHGQRAKDTL